LASIQPRFIFFPHWNEKVPAEIIETYECVCFHETDVPYGRGGSPVQNLIAKGHTETVVSALRMVEEFDAGPVYAKHPLSLLGGAEEIYLRAARVVLEMIENIVVNEPSPVSQSGEATVFPRRGPQQSEVPRDAVSLAGVFDHIRMLDAEEYPRAFIRWGCLRIEFINPVLRTQHLEASVRITVVSEDGEGW
jgi:methionyl-tRNA formyltransferase